jgi:hypothetical protein
MWSMTAQAKVGELSVLVPVKVASQTVNEMGWNVLEYL